MQLLFRVVVELFDFFDVDTRKTVLLPIFIQYAASPPSELRETLAKMFGAFLWKAKSFALPIHPQISLSHTHSVFSFRCAIR